MADHAEALIGGINIADKYRGNEQELPWLDFAIGVKGPVCAEISCICERIYREKYFGKIVANYCRTHNTSSQWLTPEQAEEMHIKIVDLKYPWTK